VSSQNNNNNNKDIHNETNLSARSNDIYRFKKQRTPSLSKLPRNFDMKKGSEFTGIMTYYEAIK
jgi:hypothetical protein